jgi:sporulation protein YlmC with PRC-barrel domain
MMKRFRYLTLLACLALLLPACRLVGQTGGAPPLPAGLAPAGRETAAPALNASPSGPAIPAATRPAATGSPAPTATPSPRPTAGPPPAARSKPPQSQAAEIRPTEMRPALTHLSALIGYRMLGENGQALGAAGDYIVNTCETYILYILMDPGTGPGSGPAGRVAIPFEAVTINSGVLDAQNRAIQLRLLPEQLAGAPALPAAGPLTPTDWEAAVREFWSRRVRIGNLTTRCNVPGGPVYKVAYASELLGAKLYDGRGDLLGAVEEAILEPESGKLGFYLVRPAQGEGWVLVRLGATNIPREALAPGATLRLVLLTEPEMFWQAPRLQALAEADSYAMQARMRRYWGSP